jgi:hypothetical protein
MFVITNNFIYIQDATDPFIILNKIPSTGNDYTISRDDDTGFIYLMTNGLVCKKAGSCLVSDRIFIDQNCTTNGDCLKIADINDLYRSLGIVYSESR